VLLHGCRHVLLLLLEQLLLLLLLLECHPAAGSGSMSAGS
jgi:hypothetical protein